MTTDKILENRKKVLTTVERFGNINFAVEKKRNTTEKIFKKSVDKSGKIW